LAPPTKGEELPKLENIACYVFPPGTGIIIHLGTWHDFPLPLLEPVTVLTMNSFEVVDALQKMEKPGEMDQGDVHKFYIPKHYGFRVEVKGMPIIKQ
jgi:ureidoglycolate lyase